MWLRLDVPFSVLFYQLEFYFGENGMERSQPEKAERALGYELLVLAVKWFLKR